MEHYSNDSPYLRFWATIFTILFVYSISTNIVGNFATKEANIHIEEMALIESKMVGEVYDVENGRGR